MNDVLITASSQVTEADVKSARLGTRFGRLDAMSQLALVAVESLGIEEAALFYLFAYTFMVIGSFGVVAIVSRRGDRHTSLDDFKGLSRGEPLLAFAFAIFLLAQAGVPLTSGFFAKFFVLEASVNAQNRTPNDHLKTGSKG
jgi:NADH-quinone oxidoreductase subunit N